jgi:DNA-binding beta-propeller fold protein YncE
VASDGSVYVADTNNYRIQKFTSEGVFVIRRGTYGSGNGQFDKPRGVAVASDGSVYVADSKNNRIQKFAAGP